MTRSIYGNSKTQTVSFVLKPFINDISSISTINGTSEIQTVDFILKPFVNSYSTPITVQGNTDIQEIQFVLRPFINTLYEEIPNMIQFWGIMDIDTNNTFPGLQIWG